MKLDKNPSHQDIRRFMAIWPLMVACAGGLLFWRHHPLSARVLWCAALGVGLSGNIFGSLGRVFYRAWMGLAYGINWLITRILLMFIFWGVLTPMALLFKILRRDVLRLKPPRSASYWQDHDKMTDLSSYRHLY